MPDVFLTGAFAWPALREVVLGDISNARTVSVEGVSLSSANMAFPLAVPQAGERLEAVAVRLDDGEAFHRLSYLAAVIGMHPVPKHAEGDIAAGVTFLSDHDKPAADPWNMDDWQNDWGQIAIYAAEEILGYYRRVEAHALTWRLPMILARAAARCTAEADAAPATLRRDLGADAVTLHASQATHEGFFLTRQFDLSYPRFDGSRSETLSREVFVVGDAVIVLPYDPKRDRVLLVEQFRMGPFGRGDPRPWVLEPPAGRVDAGESPQEAARRECEEEAGLSLRSLHHISSHYCSPGASTEYYHCYLALADLPEMGSGFGGLATEHEDIRTHVISFEEAMALVKSGEANIGPMILMLLWLERERPRLRSEA